MTQIKELLVALNPWWKTGFKAGYKDREIYAEIKKFMKTPQIIALTGMRRVGKTTLMHKMVEDAVNSGFEAKNIVLFSFDEFRQAKISDVLKEYAELTEKNLSKGSYLVLLDEIQKVGDWENQVKTIYDLHQKNVKLVISGSESLFIRKKSRESLAGRIFEFKVEKLGFKEFLAFKNKKLEPAGIYEGESKKLFNEFILTQGFPELVEVKDKDIIVKYIRESIIEKIVYRDLASMFNVKDIETVASLLNIIMEEPGQIIELTELAKEMNASRQTISEYLKYLEDAFVVRKLYNFSRNRRKIERKLKKYYPAVLSPRLVFNEDTASKSKVFESIIVNQLNAEFFWRDPYKNEVDIVLGGKKIVPIEVKYGKTETKGLLAFMKKFKVSEGHILSQDKEETQEINGKTIHVTPAHKFLQKTVF